MKSHAVIFANGDPIHATLREKLRKGRFSIALDGAAEAIRKQKWLPNLLSGDLDSVRPSTLRYFQKMGVEILETSDQNHTDLEKALAWTVLRNFSSIWIAQAFGDRTDHSFTNLALLRRFYQPDREILLFRNKEKIQFLNLITRKFSHELPV